MESPLEEIDLAEAPTNYHEVDSYISRGDLATFAESRRLYHGIHVAKTIDGTIDADCLSIGTATHAVALADVVALSRCVQIPKHVLTSNGQRRGLAWDTFEAEHAGKTLLLPRQVEMAKRCAASLHRELGPLLSSGDAYRELEIYWDDTIPSRCKLDFVIERHQDVLVIDLKTAADISQRGFTSAIYARKYWLQDAHYSRGAEVEFGKPARFMFAAVEKKEPFRSFLYELNPFTRATARAARETLMEQMLGCYGSGNWADPQEGVITEIELKGELV